MIVVIDNTHNLRKAYMTPKLIKLIEDYTKNPPITLSNEDEVNDFILNNDKFYNIFKAYNILQYLYP